MHKDLGKNAVSVVKMKGLRRGRPFKKVTNLSGRSAP